MFTVIQFVLHQKMPQGFAQIQIVTAIFAIMPNITVGGGQTNVI